MYINSSNKIIYSDYEKKNNITVDKNLISVLKDNNYPLFFNNIHFIQRYYRQYANQNLINKSINTIYHIANNQGKYYSEVIISKRNGKDRKLHVPCKELKHLQRFILNSLLSWYKPLDCVMGYVKGRGIKENAKVHLNSNYILKLDISDFFGSIHFGKIVNNILPSIYDENLKVLVTNLCMFNGSLPQGAPTSPIISNIVMAKFDEIVSNYCMENNLVYTRYADDMFISSENDFDYKKVLHKIEYLLKKYYSMKLNREKTHYLHDGLKEELCGVIVNEKMQTGKKYRDSIRQEMYYLDKYGVEKHIYALFYDKKIDSVISPLEYYKKLLGKINHVLNINPEDNKFIEYRKKISNYIEQLTPKKENVSQTKKYPKQFDEYFKFSSKLHFDFDNASIEEKVLYNFMNGIDDNEKLYDDVYDEGGVVYKLYSMHGDIDRALLIAEQNYEKYYKLAYEDNNLVATYLLLIYLINQENREEDLVDYWSKRLSSMGIYRGIFIKACELEDVSLLRKSANNKDPKAQLELAIKYYEKNSSQYIKYILASAENNYPKAFEYALNIYLDFRLYEDAFYWAIKGSLTESQYCLETALKLSREYNFSLPDEVKDNIEEYCLDYE